MTDSARGVRKRARPSGWLADPDSGPAREFEPNGLMVFSPLVCVGAAIQAAMGDFQPSWPAWVAIAAVIALYVLAVHRAFAERRRAARWLLAALGVVVPLCCLGYGGAWFYVFPLLALACGIVLTGRWAPRAALAVAVLAMALLWYRDGGLTGILALGWGTFTSGAIIAGFLHLHAVIGELNRTREQLAGAAIAEERLRFSRDLHDLLGHTLSVMVVKAEVVRRVLDRSPDEAERQAADIEQLGRTALAEVRAAVTGYRGRGLAAELDSARVALADSGIEPAMTIATLSLTPEADALLGWAVREGVTNVIRHSRARSCLLTLGRDQDEITLRIHDDGAQAPGDLVPGNGLRGLRERALAQGGTLDADPVTGGFVLTVTLPGGHP